MKETIHAIKIPLVLIFTLFFAGEAVAGYTIVPMQFAFNGKPGETVTSTMTAENLGEEGVSIEISTKDFIKGLYGEERQVEPGAVRRGCASWIRISPRTVELAPREIKIIQFSMTIPMDGEGSYWGNILVSQVSKPTLGKTIKRGGTSFQIFALQDMLIRVLENVPGTEEKRGVITDISLDERDGGRATVEVTFENQGSSLLKCEGQIEIRDENGDTVRTIPLDYGHAPFTVYPGDRRIVHGRIGEKLPSGDYILITIIDYGGEELVAGELEWLVER